MITTSEIRQRFNCFHVGGDGGFTLLETLVATMVLAISLTVIFQLFSGGLNQARRSSDYTPRRLACHRQDGGDLACPLTAGSSDQGYFEDGYQWTVVVGPVETIADEAKPALPLAVKVTVSWEVLGQTKKVALETIALGTAAESA